MSQVPLPPPAAPPPDRTTAELVTAARGGDRAAFGRLVVRYEGRVRAVALAQGCDPEGAEDVAQDAFLSAHRSLSTLEEAAAFPAWIAAIARNAAISALRRAGHAPALRGDLDARPEAAQRGAPDRALARASVREDVRRALARLEEKARLALTLKHHAGLSYAEIAETMALPPTTIKGLLERGTRELRYRLASLGEASR